MLTLMVSTRGTNKLKRVRKNKGDTDFVALYESETESEEWDHTMEDARATVKGKAPAEPIESGKKKTTPRKKKRSGGICIEEPLASAPPSNTKILYILTLSG